MAQEFNPTAEVKTEAEFADIRDAYARIAAFKQFVLDRFAAYAPVHLGIDVLKTVENGWTIFRVREHTLFNDSPDIEIEKYTADDRGPGYGKNLKMPKSALFEVTEVEKARAEYDRLGAEFGFAKA